MKKITAKWLSDNISTGSTWSMKHDVYTVRLAYFYRPINTNPEQYGERVKSLIEAAIPNTIVTIQETGDIWKPFRGGASVRNQSHYFVKFTIHQSSDE